MDEVAELGLAAARHLRSEIYEVRASGTNRTYRVLFAAEGRRGQVLLALEAFAKKQQRTPPDAIDLALQRLRDWRSRGR
jgi:phage-related protein